VVSTIPVSDNEKRMEKLGRTNVSHNMAMERNNLVPTPAEMPVFLCPHHLQSVVEDSTVFCKVVFYNV